MSMVLEGLRLAKELLEGGWTQHTRARDAENNPVAVGDPRAVRFCIEGACDHVEEALGAPDGMLQAYVESALISRGEDEHIPAWNDKLSRTKEEVLELMEEAIRAVKQ